jgi:hypothetical protein
VVGVALVSLSLLYFNGRARARSLAPATAEVAHAG